MSYASDKGLKVGDTILYTGKGTCFGMGNFGVGDILTLHYDDHTDQPQFTSASTTACFDLNSHQWEKLTPVVTKDTIFNLEVTGEELLLLRIITGKCDGAITAKHTLYTKAATLLQDMNKGVNSYCCDFEGVTLSLVNVQGKFKDLVSTVFPLPIVKSQEEIEYDKLQQQIVELQAQALKLKPKGSK